MPSTPTIPVDVFSGDGGGVFLGRGVVEERVVVKAVLLSTVRGLSLVRDAEDPTREPVIQEGIAVGRLLTPCPRIRLQGGRVVYGCDVWWTPVGGLPMSGV